MSRCGILLFEIAGGCLLDGCGSVFKARKDVSDVLDLKEEIREAVELPLTHFDLYRQIGTGLRAA